MAPFTSQRLQAHAHTAHATIGATMSADASWPQVIQPSYSAALAIVPSMIECKATIETGRAANQWVKRLIIGVLCAEA